MKERENKSLNQQVRTEGTKLVSRPKGGTGPRSKNYRHATLRERRIVEFTDLFYLFSFLALYILLDNIVPNDSAVYNQAVVFNILPSVITGLIGLIASLFSNRSNRRAVSETNRAQVELANQEHARNLELYHAQNLYNSPAEQMNRLMSAGLNPRLIYTSGNAAGNFAGTAPQVDMPQLQSYTGNRYDTQGFQSVMPLMLQSRMQEEQFKHMEHQNAVLAQQTINETLRAAGQSIQNAQSEFDLGLAKKLEENTLAVANANLNRIASETELVKTNISYDGLRRSLTQAQIRQIDESLRKLRLDYDIADFNQSLNRIGINAGDPTWVRILSRSLLGSDSTSMRTFSPVTGESFSVPRRYTRWDQLKDQFRYAWSFNWLK